MEFQHVESFAVGRFIVGESNGNTALKSEKEGIRGCVDGKGSFESNCRDLQYAIRAFFFVLCVILLS